MFEVAIYLMPLTVELIFEVYYFGGNQAVS